MQAHHDQALLKHFALSLTPVPVLKGQILFKPGDLANRILVIVDGVIEVLTYFEGRRFVIERLFRGSVLNYKNIFLEEE